MQGNFKLLFNGWWSHEGYFRVIQQDYIEYFTCAKSSEELHKNGVNNNVEIGKSCNQTESNMNGGENTTTITEETCLNTPEKSLS